MNASDVIEGRYRLERLLGTGGMAEVWLAEDQRLRRWVAVKLLREAFSSEADAETIAAFEREATVIAGLQHPNIVGVFDTGVHEGRRFLVMEYVHGYSLRQLLESQGRLTEAEAIRYGAQIASALHYAHGRGVVHCDIKPENVIVSETGAAKVADFGVAETLTRTMTPGQAHELLGTIAYLAPEIIEGSNPAPASDVYSLGLTVFELVAGRSPFGGATAGAALGQRLATPAPALRTFARGASPELEAVLARALALSPADRFPNAGAFAAALQRVPQGTARPAAPIAAPPGPQPQMQRRHTTARIRRMAPAPPPPRGSGIAASTLLLAAGIVLAALGVGIAAAIVISRSDDDKGGGSPTPTAEASQTAGPTDTQAPPTQRPTGTAEPSPSPSPSQSPSQSPTPQASPTPTRTTAPSPSATQGNPSPSPSAAASPAATATPN